MQYTQIKTNTLSAPIQCTNLYEIDRVELTQAVKTLKQYNLNNSVIQLVESNTEKIERTLKAILNKQTRALTDVNTLIPTYCSKEITKALVKDIQSLIYTVKSKMSTYSLSYLFKAHSDFFTKRRCYVNVQEPTLESVFSKDLVKQDSTILTDRDVELPTINNKDMVEFKSNNDVVIKVWYIIDMNRPRTSRYIGKEFTIKNGKKKWDKAQEKYEQEYAKKLQELYSNKQLENNKRFFEKQNLIRQAQEILNAVEVLCNALYPIIAYSLLQTSKPLHVQVLNGEMQQIEKLQDIQAQLYTVKFGGEPTNTQYLTLIELANISYQYISGLQELYYRYKNSEEVKEVA